MSGNANLYAVGVGTASLANLGIVPIIETRNPAPTDTHGPSGSLHIGQEWINSAANSSFVLTSLTTVGGQLQATWSQTGSSGALNTLTGDSGGTVTPVSGNIDMLGGSSGFTFVGSAGTLTLTGSLPGSVTFVENTGSAVPSAGTLNVLGGTGVTTTGSGNTITIDAAASVATSYIENSGTAVPAANALHVVGTSGITTSGAGSTITVTTDGTIATLYSEDSGSAAPVGGILDIHGGAGITTAGSGFTVTISADGTVPLLFTENSGTAAPALNNLNVVGTGVVSTAGSGSTITISSTATESYPITQYVVGPVGLAGYQTIQSAINAAAGSLSGTGNVYVMPGTYNESLSLAIGVNVIGANLEGLEGTAPGVVAAVTINGNATLAPVAASGAVLLEGLYMNASSGDALTVAPSDVATAIAALEHCVLNAPSGHAIALNGSSGTFDLAAWTTQFSSSGEGIFATGSGGDVELYGCSIVSSTSACVYFGSSGMNLSLYENCQLTGSGSGAFYFNAADCAVTSYGSFLSCPDASVIQFPASGTVMSNGDTFASNAASGYYVSGAGNFHYNYVNLTGTAVFLDPAVIQSPSVANQGSTTIYGGQTGFVNVSVNSGTSPYTALSTDFYIAVDSAGGPVTVNLPAVAVVGAHYIVADGFGFAATNNITVDGNSANIVWQGAVAATAVLNANYQALDVTFDGTDWLASAGQANAPPAPSSLVWVDRAASATVLVGQGNFTTAAITLTLPAAPVQGDTCEFYVDTAGQLIVMASGTQKIRLSTSLSAAGGTAANSQGGDALTLVYRAANTIWLATSIVGGWTVT